MSRAGAILSCKAGLVFAGTIALAGCSDDCANRIVSRLPSPDGQRHAVLFQRDCRATTGLSTPLSILAPGEVPEGGGNAYRADDYHGAAAVGAWGGPWADARWLAPDHLLIRYATRSSVFERKVGLSGVRISYQPVER